MNARTAASLLGVPAVLLVAWLILEPEDSPLASTQESAGHSVGESARSDLPPAGPLAELAQAPEPDVHVRTPASREGPSSDSTTRSGDEEPSDFDQGPPPQRPSVGPPETWERAREDFTLDLLPTEEEEEEFEEWLYRLTFNVHELGRLVMNDVDLSKDPRGAAESYLAQCGIEFEGDTEQLLESCEDVLRACRDHIDAESDNALSLYKESVHEYIARDAYVRWGGEGPAPYPVPAAEYYRQDGLFARGFKSRSWGWAAAIAFDSADFPVFEGELQGIDDAKRACLRSLEELLGVHGGGQAK